jgi:hypothetical protein
MFGVATNCVNCKLLSSQVFYNAKKERICAGCLQKDYDSVCIKVSGLCETLDFLAGNNKKLAQTLEGIKLLLKDNE